MRRRLPLQSWQASPSWERRCAFCSDRCRNLERAGNNRRRRRPDHDASRTGDPAATPIARCHRIRPARAQRHAVETVGSSRRCRSGPVDGVAIATQRASTVLWDRASGEPVGPGIGWQDFRTVGLCLSLRRRGVRLAPNQSATKLAYLLDTVASRDNPDLCFGTIDSWLVWRLSRGRSHVTDATNAGVTGLVLEDARDWDDRLLDVLRIPQRRCRPSSIPRVTAATRWRSRAHRRSWRSSAINRHRSSVRAASRPAPRKRPSAPGRCSTAASGPPGPLLATRGEAGTFPIVAWRAHNQSTWGIEGIALTAGSCVDWLRDGLELIDAVEETDALASSVRDSGGVTFVPALGGIGTPLWDFGARGALIGLDDLDETGRGRGARGARRNRASWCRPCRGRSNADC